MANSLTNPTVKNSYVEVVNAQIVTGTMNLFFEGFILLILSRKVGFGKALGLSDLTSSSFPQDVSKSPPPCPMLACSPAGTRVIPLEDGKKISPVGRLVSILLDFTRF